MLGWGSPGDTGAKISLPSFRKLEIPGKQVGRCRFAREFPRWQVTFKRYSGGLSESVWLANCLASALRCSSSIARSRQVL